MQLPTLGLLLACVGVHAVPAGLSISAGIDIGLGSSHNKPAGEAGAVFAMTNNPAKNEVIAFSRASNGALTEVGHYATGGRGQGVDFDTQGGLVLNADRTFLYAVNPADDLVTVFSVHGSSLCRVQTIYAGDQPLAITISSDKRYAYVLDGSVASTGIFGFKVDPHSGILSPLTNKTVSTSTPIGVPGTVIFSPDNKSLIVTNKVGSTLDVFSVDQNGGVGSGPVSTIDSSGQRPFAAAFDKAGHLFVVESGLPVMKNAGVSSYSLKEGSKMALSPITKASKNQQTDGCWIVTTADDKWAYTANFISGTLSQYAIKSDGTATLVKGNAFSQGNTSQPVDLGLSKDGKYLYNLQRGAGGVVGLEIQADGSLKQVGKVVGQSSLPAMVGVSGMTAF